MQYTNALSSKSSDCQWNVQRTTSGTYADQPNSGKELHIRAKPQSAVMTRWRVLALVHEVVAYCITIALSMAKVAWCRIIPKDRKTVINPYQVQAMPDKPRELWDALAITPTGYARTACNQSPTVMLRISLLDGTRSLGSLKNVKSTGVLSPMAIIANSA